MGTDAGTELVSDIRPGPGSSDPKLLTNVNGTLLFAANDGTHGIELWRSDGTEAGTKLVKDINPGGGNSLSVSDFASVNGTLFFSAFDSAHGIELWRSDGTESGTKLVKDINPGFLFSDPGDLTE
jgi:ELWxxDGT repeat protein